MTGKNLQLADEFALEYDNSVLSNSWTGPETIFGMANHRLKSGSKILDLGIGTGESAKRFQQAGHLIIGVDGSRNMLEECRKKGIGKELFHHNLETVPFPFSENNFDAVISNGVFHLVHPVSGIFTESARILRSGGFFVFTFEEAGAVSKFNPVEPGIWKQTTPTGVDTYKHEAKYISEVLAKNGFAVLEKRRFKAFENRKSKTVFYFTAVVAQKE